MSEGRELKIILVVDDEVELCELVAGAIQSEGYEVLTSNGGDHAYKIIEQHQGKIDAVLSDIKMPLGGGIELLRKLKENDIPVKFFLMTGYSEFDREQLKSAGSLEVFSKPLNFDLLFDELEKALA